MYAKRSGTYSLLICCTGRTRRWSMGNKPVGDLEVKTQEVLDWIYAGNSEEYAPHLEIGIWDWESVPYTFYAVIKNRDGSTLCGESSYDSETIEDAIDCVLKELHE